MLNVIKERPALRRMLTTLGNAVTVVTGLAVISTAAFIGYAFSQGVRCSLTLFEAVPYEAVPFDAVPLREITRDLAPGRNP